MNQDDYAKQLLEDMGVGSTAKMGKFEQMKLGRHRLILLNLGLKKNQKKGGPYRIQAEFVVDSSTVYEPGSKTSLSFFTQRETFPEYEVSRFQDMLEVIAQGTGDTRTQAELGAMLMTEAGRGITIDVEITPDVDEDKDRTYTSESWAPVTQSADDIAAAREFLNGKYGAWEPMRADNKPRPAANAGYQAAKPTIAAPAPGAQFAGNAQPAPAAARPSLLKRS